MLEWILVEDRLPDLKRGKSRRLIVTMEDRDRKRFTTTAKFDQKYKEWHSFTSRRFYKKDFKVIAWMKKPEPYDSE